jgi:hypothetical protein
VKNLKERKRRKILTKQSLAKTQPSNLGARPGCIQLVVTDYRRAI